MPDVGEQIGKDYPTYIPSLIDIADIQNAFKDYHHQIVLKFLQWQFLIILERQYGSFNRRLQSLQVSLDLHR